MSTDIWSRIAKLRIRDTDLLAPVVKRALDHGIAAATETSIDVNSSPDVVDTVSLDPMVIETLRVAELQEIYFTQGSSKQRSVLKSMHCYGVAFDLISVQYGWFTDARAIKRWPDRAVRTRVALSWYRAVAKHLMDTKELAWGGLWKRFPDSPHFQSSRVPVVPNDLIITTYQKAGGGQAGREAVWELYQLN